MMMLHEGDLFILYNNAGVFLGNGSRESIFRIFKKWGRKANGSRIRLLNMMENFSVGTSFKKHEEYVRNEWKNNRDDEAEELLEEAIVSVTGVEYVKAKKKPRVLKSVILSSKEEEEKDNTPVKIIRTKMRLKKKYI